MNDPSILVGVVATASKLPPSPMLWLSFAALVGLIIAFDLGWSRHAVPRIKTCCMLTVGYALLAGVFGAWLTAMHGVHAGALFATAYLVEVSLSIDNLLVISMVFAHLAIPQQFQRRVLFWGILGAIVMRGLLILVGAAAIERFHWILIGFAILIVLTGVRILFSRDETTNVADAPFLRLATRFLRVDPELSEQRFIVHRQRLDGTIKRYATPLLLALVVIEAADLVFAIDSIPAALAISTDPLIVFTSNVFAVVGLRAMYFALAGSLVQLVYLRHALGILLIFIGGKIGYEEFVADLDPLISLGVTLALLGGGVTLSQFHNWRARRRAGAGSGPLAAE